MIRKVESWITSDGIVHQTEKQAKNHELLQSTNKSLEDLLKDLPLYEKRLVVDLLLRKSDSILRILQPYNDMNQELRRECLRED